MRAVPADKEVPTRTREPKCGKSAYISCRSNYKRRQCCCLLFQRRIVPPPPEIVTFSVVANAPNRGRTMPSPFWVANPFSPCDLDPQLKSSPMNNRTRGGVGLSAILPGQRAYGVIRQGQHNILFDLTRCCFKLDAFIPLLFVCFPLRFIPSRNQYGIRPLGASLVSHGILCLRDIAEAVWLH